MQRGKSGDMLLVLVVVLGVVGHENRREVNVVFKFTF